MDQKKFHSVEYGKYKDKQLKWVAKNDIEFFKQIEKLYYNKYSEKKKALYDKIKNLFLKTGEKENDELFQEKVFKVFSLLKERKTNEQILAFLRAESEYSAKNHREITLHAKALVRKQFSIEREFLLDIHIIRYEEIYDNNINMDLSHIVQPGYRNAIKCENYLTAMETLYQKERLLGIHTKKFKEQIRKLNGGDNFKTKIDFDINKLKLKEQVELYNLLQKAKPNEELIKSIQGNEDEKIIIQDNNENTEIDTPITKSKQTNIIDEEKNKVIENSGKSLEEVRQSMNESLKDKIKKMYDDKFKK